MAKRKINWPLLGAVAGVCLAPFTGGASLAMAGKVLVPTLAASAGLGYVSGKVVESAVDNGSSDDDGTQKLLEQQKLQNEQFNASMKQNREELEKIRKERLKKEKKLRENNKELEILKSKLNDPNISPEEKERIKKKIILLENDNRELKKEIENLKRDEDKKDKEKPTIPTLPWKFPKFSAYDKLLMTGVLTLLIYYLFLREEKK